MSEEISPEGAKSTEDWDILADDIEWLEEQSKSENAEVREKAKKYIAKNIAKMSAILGEISEDNNKQIEESVPIGDVEIEPPTPPVDT